MAQVLPLVRPGHWVAVGGGRSLPSFVPPVVRFWVQSAVSFGVCLSVGCATGADQSAIIAALAALGRLPRPGFVFRLPFLLPPLAPGPVLRFRLSRPQPLPAFLSLGWLVPRWQPPCLVGWFAVRLPWWLAAWLAFGSCLVVVRWLPLLRWLPLVVPSWLGFRLAPLPPLACLALLVGGFLAALLPFLFGFGFPPRCPSSNPL